MTLLNVSIVVDHRTRVMLAVLFSIFMLNPRHLMLDSSLVFRSKKTMQMIGLTSEITDEVSFGRRDQPLHLCPQMNSDHFSVIADLNIPTDHSRTVPQAITYRKLKAINIEAFKPDITNPELISNPKTNATDQAQQYCYNMYYIVVP